MSEDLPPVVEVAGKRAHLHFWLQRPDGLWGGLRREDSIPDDLQGFGSKNFSYRTEWYCHSSLVTTVKGYENRPVPTFDRPRTSGE